MVRRAAGTETFTDVLLRLVRVRRPSAEQDRKDLDAGETLVVAAFSKTLGGERLIGAGKGRTVRLSKRGELHLRAGGPPVWVQKTGGALTLDLVPPFALRGEGEKVPGGPQFRRFDLATGSGTYDLAVPLKDLELVRHALG